MHLPRAVRVTPLLAVAWLLPATACKPHIGDCQVRCDVAADDCPPGLTCDGTGMCRTGDTTEACGGMVDAGLCAGWTFVPDNVDPCALPEPSAPFPPGEGVWVFNTGSDELTDPVGQVLDPPPFTRTLVLEGGGISARVLVFDSFTLGMEQTLKVTGTYPLIIVSRSDVTIDGLLDGSADSSYTAGPGADSAVFPCGDRSGQAGVDGSGQSTGGGGGGGGLHAGAAGLDGSGGGTAGGAGGVAQAGLVPLVGGCRGGDSGIEESEGYPTKGGAGGGGIEIVARNTLTIAGTIDVGAGGASSGYTAYATLLGIGGGGGGAGGNLVLAASQVVLLATSRLCAAGGGGGAGGNTDSSYSNPGGEATCDGNPASGGTDQTSLDELGGSGGAFDAPTQGVYRNTTEGEGGPGGGGSAGQIAIRSYDQAPSMDAEVVVPEADVSAP